MGAKQSGVAFWAHCIWQHSPNYVPSEGCLLEQSSGVATTIWAKFILFSQPSRPAREPLFPVIPFFGIRCPRGSCSLVDFVNFVPAFLFVISSELDCSVKLLFLFTRRVNSMAAFDKASQHLYSSPRPLKPCKNNYSQLPPSTCF